MTHFVSSYGLWVVFVVVFLEVAGLPFVPGETALIASAALASQGKGNVVASIALAVLAAVLGALLGYVVGRTRGRELLARWAWFERVSHRGVEKSDAFFQRHGSKAVFFARFVPVLRATLGWMAGIGRMPFWPFFFWNVAGAVVWGCLVGLAAYYLGDAVVTTIERSLGVGIAVLAGIVALLVGVHLLRRRLER
ncbi:MAG TPA: DedA family protein [Gaiellaceae bacterium]|nr:DedA family protein [Gaiellaceae bacterium]